MSPPDTSHVYNSLFFVRALAKDYHIDYYGVEKHRKVIEESGATFCKYPKGIANKIWLASPYNLPAEFPEISRDYLIKHWETSKEILSFELLKWLFNIAADYSGIITDIVFYQRTGFVVPYITASFDIALVSSCTSLPREKTYTLKFLPDDFDTTVAHPLLFRL